MNQIRTAEAICRLRKRKKMTQAQLGDLLGVSDKAVSRWETGKGYPDITLLEPLCAALGVSVNEFFEGESSQNGNASGNMMRSTLYVCPICGNIIHAVGEACISCCGFLLQPLAAAAEDEQHSIIAEPVEDEWYLTADHPMTKEHYLSLFAFAGGDRFDLVKLYPEGNAEARIKRRGHGILYYYCNQHGLFKKIL